ncbi:MAG: hypothetical protein JWP02_692 [Acidimicrobiales bacterium]|nr:hypothetical protein [Acidimicrobiales bacterium]
MEDRIDAGLWLQTADTPPMLSAGAVHPGSGHGNSTLEASSWWENACPDRTDLPRKLDEFAFLAISEVAAGFRPSDESAGWHFRRTPRPGQGVLSGRPTRGLLVVLVGVRSPDQAQAFRDWADFTHIRHIAASDDSSGLMITPYENAIDGADPRFLHLYELETDDPEQWFKGMPDRVAQHLAGGPGSAAFEDWAYHPALRILYVNTFRRVDA